MYKHKNKRMKITLRLISSLVAFLFATVVSAQYDLDVEIKLIGNDEVSTKNIPSGTIMFDIVDGEVTVSYTDLDDGTTMEWMTFNHSEIETMKFSGGDNDLISFSAMNIYHATVVEESNNKEIAVTYESMKLTLQLSAGDKIVDMSGIRKINITNLGSENSITATPDSGMQIYYSGDLLCIDSETPIGEIEVFSITGKSEGVYRTSSTSFREKLDLPKGTYIISVGENVKKIAVL